MCHRCVLDLDSLLLGKFLKFAECEVHAIVGDDAAGHTVSAGDGLEELDSCGRLLIGHRCRFDPFGELVDCDQQVGVSAT
jgi:hypothetical protein